MSWGSCWPLYPQISEARLTRAAGVTVLVVAVSKWVNMFEISEMATDPDQANIFVVDNFDDIENIKTNLEATICNGTITPPPPPLPKQSLQCK